MEIGRCKMEKEKATERIYMKIKPSVKTAAEKKAEKENRTLSKYIEWLIIKDTNKK